MSKLFAWNLQAFPKLSSSVLSLFKELREQKGFFFISKLFCPPDTPLGRCDRPKTKLARLQLFVNKKLMPLVITRKAKSSRRSRASTPKLDRFALLAMTSAAR